MSKASNQQIFLMQQTFATLFTVTNKLQNYADTNYKKLTSRQFMTLLAIAHIECEASISNIAKSLKTTKQSVAQIIRNLEKHNYIQISPSKLDKRKVQITITSTGNEIMEEYYEIGKETLFTWFHKFSEDELSQFCTFLKKLCSFDDDHHDGFEKELGKNHDEIQ